MKKNIVYFQYLHRTVHISIIIIAVITSCTRLSPTEKDLKKNLNKTLKLDMFEAVQQGDTFLSFEEFRKRYKYMSVVYLQDGCRPCYPKFIEWHGKIDSIVPPNDYTVLLL